MNEQDEGLSQEERDLFASLRDSTPPIPDLEAETLALLHKRGLIDVPTSFWQRKLSIGWLAAACIAFMALGKMLSAPAYTPSEQPGRQFLLLLHESFHTAASTPDAAEEYSRWAQDIGDAFIDGAELGQDILQLQPSPAGLETTATSAQGDHIAGYFILRAENLKAATTLAKDCPHLRNGWIELRPLVQ